MVGDVRPQRRRLGLSLQLLALTVLFVMVSAMLIYIPSIANFRIAWLSDRMTMADAAGTVLSEGVTADVPQDAQDDLLKAVGAVAIALRNGTVSRLVASDDTPPMVDEVVDLRSPDPFAGVPAARIRDTAWSESFSTAVRKPWSVFLASVAFAAVVLLSALERITTSRSSGEIAEQTDFT